jgi:hypothetical protein
MVFGRSVARLCSPSSLIRRFLETPPELVRLTTPLSQELVPTRVAELSKTIIERAEKIHQLRLDRMELLSLPAHSVGTRNKELAALGIGAVSGALSLSFHPAFALIFIVSYRMYKKANRPTEIRLGSADRVKKINEDMSTLSDANAKDICEIRNSVSEIS